jgi:hypothetical protein
VYAMQFDVEVTESGHAGRVKLKDSTPSERGLESCIARALEGMASPVPVMRLISQQPVSPESRGLLGQPLPAIAVAGGGALAPIFIFAAGITVIVAVALYVSAETAEAERRRKLKKKRCLEMYVDCADRPYPCTKPRDRDYYLCSHCRTNCDNEAPYFTSLCTQCGFK